MPSYDEIYGQYANEYDELVRHEDHEGHLKRALAECFDWQDKRVLEAGIGTGRLTRTYLPQVRSVLGTDRSIHMLNRAEQNLKSHRDKITLAQYDNLSLHQIEQTFDIFIEGWAFGHSITDYPNNTYEITKRLIIQASGLLNPGGITCFIETLGTNTERPQPPNKLLALFYNILEENYGFEKVIVDTSYRFKNNREAQKVMGFFFGKEMEASVKATGGPIIPEWTGIWYRKG